MTEFELLGGLPGIFRNIFQQEQSGTLQIQRGEGDDVFVYLANGMVRLITTAHKRSVLAEGLRRTKGIDKEKLDLVFAKQRETKKTLLSVVSEISLCEPEKQRGFIIDICRTQVEEDIYEIMSSRDVVNCEFFPNKLDESIFDLELVELPINLNPESLSVEAARRKDEWDLMRKQIPSQKDIPCLMTPEDGNSNLDEDSRLILSYINGIRDFDEIFGKVPFSTFNTAKIVCDLLKNGEIRLREAHELKQMTTLDILKKDTFKCIRLYERLEELGLKDLDTSGWLARAYEKSGLTNKAVDKYRELGISAINAQEYQEAVTAYRKVVQLAPEDLEAYDRLIHSYYKSQELEKAAEVSAVYARKISVVDKRKAIMVLDEANKSFPASPSNLELMATLYIEMGDKKNAISTYNVLASLLRNKEQFENVREQALDAYRRILQIDPANIQAHIELADGLIELKKQAEAVDQYKELGQLLFQNMNNEDEEYSEILIAVCKCIIQYEPNSIDALNWLVDAYLLKKDSESAMLYLRQLLELLQQDQNMDVLVANLRKLVQLNKQDFKSRKLLANTLLRMGKKREAVQEYTSLGFDTYDINDLRLSREAFEAILRVAPFDLTARQKHADILRQLNRQARAVEEYKLVGHLAKSVKKYREAMDAFAHVVELAPGTELSGFIEVARLCEALEDIPKAVEYYRSYVLKSLEQGNYGEAAQICQQILSLDPSDSKAQRLKEKAEEKLAKFREKYGYTVDSSLE